MGRVNQIIPIVKVSDIQKAVSFYCDHLGFTQISLFQRERNQPGYATLERDGCRLHASSFPGDGTLTSCVYIQVDDIGALQADLLKRGWEEKDVQIMNQDWGNREIYVSDGDGNNLRFGN